MVSRGLVGNPTHSTVRYARAWHLSVAPKVAAAPPQQQLTQAQQAEAAKQRIAAAVKKEGEPVPTGWIKLGDFDKMTPAQQKEKHAAWKVAAGRS